VRLVKLIFAENRLAGAVIDTPGIREFGLFNLPRRELPWLFPELAGVAVNCRFPDCLHRGEPGCAVPAAIDRGLAPGRGLGPGAGCARQLPG
jgi:putative ribosome biogenesis GTPase RsgA